VYAIADTRRQPPSARDVGIAPEDTYPRERRAVHFKGVRVGRGVTVGKAVGVGLLVGLGVTVGAIVGVALGVEVLAGVGLTVIIGVGLAVTMGVVPPPPSFGPFL